MDAPKNTKEGARSMNIRETLELLGELRARNARTFEKGQPLLYVFEEDFRGDDGPFRHLPKKDRPSLARVSSPDNMSSAPIEESPGKFYYQLRNEGARVDLYAIDPATRQPRIVGKENKVKTYLVLPDQLFLPIDNVFPEGKD